ncbi:hypothetical protein HYY69_06195 [Candidatus Woesearchaeota archaeon]|nr:hypothetical protein [Candidatus Woesearchaeota archaeon]
MGRVRNAVAGLLALIAGFLPSGYSFANPPPVQVDSKPISTSSPTEPSSSHEVLEDRLPVCAEPEALILVFPSYSGVFSDDSSSIQGDKSLPETKHTIEQQLLIYQLRLEQYHQCLAFITMNKSHVEAEKKLQQQVHDLTAQTQKYVFFGYSFLSDFPGLNYHGFEISYRGKTSTIYISGGVYFSHVDLGGEDRAARITLVDVMGGAEPDEKNLTALLINLNLTYTPDFFRAEPVPWFSAELGLSSGVSLGIIYDANTYKLVITNNKKQSRNQDLDTPNDFALTPRFDIGLTGRMTFELSRYLALALGLRTAYSFERIDETTKHHFTLGTFAELGLRN